MARSWQTTGSFAWAFSQGIYLTQGVQYTIGFWFRAPGYNIGTDTAEFDNFKVQIGPSRNRVGSGAFATMAGGTTILNNVNTSVPTWTQATTTFTPAETGYHFLGFHCMTTAEEGFFVLIDDITIGFAGSPTVAAASFNIYLNEVQYTSGVDEPVFMFEALTPGRHVAGVQSVGPANELSNIIPILIHVADVAVYSKTPAADAIDVALDAEIRVRFVQDSLTTLPGLDYISISPAVQNLEASVDGGYIIITHGGFAYATTYTVTIPDTTIAYFEEELVWSFRTLDPPPAFVSTLPADNATNVATNVQIFVTFDRAITAGNLDGVTMEFYTDTGYTAFEDFTAQIHASSLIVTHEGLAGQTTFRVTVPAAAVDRFGGPDIVFSFRTGDPTGIAFRDEEGVVASIYPNPVDDVLNIQTNETVRRIEIFNLQGALVMAFEGHTNSINVSVLPTGTYVIRLTTDSGVSTQRFVKR